MPRDWASAPVWSLSRGAGAKEIVRDIVNVASVAQLPVLDATFFLVVAGAFVDAHTFVRVVNDVAADGARRVFAMMEAPVGREVLDALAPGCQVIHPGASDALIAWSIDRALG